MYILLVEDNSLNASFLSRLLENTSKSTQIRVVDNAFDALMKLTEEQFDCVILDGKLADANKEAVCHGPALANTIWQYYPQMPIIAWTDSKPMQEAFSKVFDACGKASDKRYFWPKKPDIEQISLSLGWINFAACRNNHLIESYAD